LTVQPPPSSSLTPPSLPAQLSQGSLFPLEAGAPEAGAPGPSAQVSGRPASSPTPRPCVGVTVRTPAGASSAFAVERGDEAYMLTERAIGHFVGMNQLEPGPFRLGLLRGNTIVELAADAELLTEGVTEGDVLHLISTQPQIDALLGRRRRLRR
jgi:hypothetical protein